MRKRQTMEIIETFGHYVENLTDKKPQSARRLLKTGWEAQNLKYAGQETDACRQASCKSDDGYHAAAHSETGRFCYCKYFYTLRNDAGGGITSL